MKTTQDTSAVGQYSGKKVEFVLRPCFKSSMIYFSFLLSTFVCKNYQILVRKRDPMTVNKSHSPVTPINLTSTLRKKKIHI